MRRQPTLLERENENAENLSFRVRKKQRPDYRRQLLQQRGGTVLHLCSREKKEKADVFALQQLKKRRPIEPDLGNYAAGNKKAGDGNTPIRLGKMIVGARAPTPSGGRLSYYVRDKRTKSKNSDDVQASMKDRHLPAVGRRKDVPRGGGKKHTAAA